MSNTIEDLEIKIAYLEDYINQLNSEVILQGKKIDRLIEVNNQLKEKVTILEEGGSQIENKPPPHY